MSFLFSIGFANHKKLKDENATLRHELETCKKELAQTIKQLANANLRSAQHTNMMLVAQQKLRNAGLIDEARMESIEKVAREQHNDQ